MQIISKVTKKLARLLLSIVKLCLSFVCRLMKCIMKDDQQKTGAIEHDWGEGKRR